MKSYLDPVLLSKRLQNLQKSDQRSNNASSASSAFTRDSIHKVRRPGYTRAYWLSTFRYSSSHRSATTLVSLHTKRTLHDSVTVWRRYKKRYLQPERKEWRSEKNELFIAEPFIIHMFLACNFSSDWDGEFRCKGSLNRFSKEKDFSEKSPEM